MKQSLRKWWGKEEKNSKGDLKLPKERKYLLFRRTKNLEIPDSLKREGRTQNVADQYDYLLMLENRIESHLSLRYPNFQENYWTFCSNLGWNCWQFGRMQIYRSFFLNFWHLCSVSVELSSSIDGQWAHPFPFLISSVFIYLLWNFVRDLRWLQSPIFFCEYFSFAFRFTCIFKKTAWVIFRVDLFFSHKANFSQEATWPSLSIE